MWLDGACGDIADPLDKLVGMFEAIEKLATSPECLGCTFQGTAAEFPDRDHPGHQVALAHKETVRDRFAELATRGLAPAQQLADQLLLLMDGAWVAARMYGPDNPAVGLTDAARTLIEAKPMSKNGTPNACRPHLHRPYRSGRTDEVIAALRASETPCGRPSRPHWTGRLLRRDRPGHVDDHQHQHLEDQTRGDGDEFTPRDARAERYLRAARCGLRPDR